MPTATAESYTLSTSKASALHSLCVLALASAFWIARNVHASNLISNPTQTLRLLWAIESPIVIFGYSFLRRNPNHCSYWKAVGRGILGLPAGALLNAFGAFILGAPIRIEYLTKTINWSLLMSLFIVIFMVGPTLSMEQMPDILCIEMQFEEGASGASKISYPEFVPAASVFGSSWKDWQRLFAHSKPIGGVDYMISLPAHGAVIGAWFGAWPMPLDWERPWQDWPICVSYGAIAGYLFGTLASLMFVHVISRRQHIKGD